MTLSLATLPHDIATAVASCLPPRDVRHAMLATSQRHLDSPFYAAFVCHATRLRVPPDPRDSATVVAACQRAIAAARPLPTRVALVVPSQLELLEAMGLQGHVHAIDIDPGRFFPYCDVLPADTWSNAALQRLAGCHRLVALTLTGSKQRRWPRPVVDVAVMAHAAPALERFVVTHLPVQTDNAALSSLTALRHLTLRFVTITSSYRDVIELPRLEHLALECVNTTRDHNDHDHDVADCHTWAWPPRLQSLDVRSGGRLGDLVFRALASTPLRSSWSSLTTLRLVERSVLTPTTVRLDLSTQPHPTKLRELVITPYRLMTDLSTTTLPWLPQIRVLHLCWDSEMPVRRFEPDRGLDDDDVASLASAVRLESLKLRLSERATHCRPLRALVRLRELHLIDGWLRDFVDCVPLLETLSLDEFCPDREDFTRRDIWPRRSRTFQPRGAAGKRRHSDVDVDAATATATRLLCPRLRTVSLGACVALNDFAMALIAPIHVLHLDRDALAWHDVFRVNTLAHLRSFTLRRTSSSPDLVQWHGTGQRLVSISSLETLCLSFCHSSLAVLPWRLAGAARLRVISLCSFDQLVLETIAEASDALAQLEEIYLTRYRGRSLVPLLALRSLRVVGLDDHLNCRRLRVARGIGGALPYLTTILHDGTDCAWHAECPLMARSDCRDYFPH